MSEREYLRDINSKIVRNKRVDYDQLQCVSIYAHNDTDTKLKGLKIDDNDYLQVSAYGDEIVEVYSQEDLNIIGTAFITPALPVAKNSKKYIMIEAPDNANDINHISLTVLVSNFTDFYELDSHYITLHKNDRTIQAEVEFITKNIQLRLDNNKGSPINTNVKIIQ